MTTYYVFAGYTYYPDGGWGDHHATFHTRPEAIAHAQELLTRSSWPRDWAHIVADGEIIWQDGHDGPKQG